MNLPQEVERWARSIPSAATALKLVVDNYAVHPTDATLVRSFMNDVYRIDGASRSYALKVYGTKRFSADEVRWEQQLARHFATAGLPVAANVALPSGDSVGTLEAPEGERHFALTEWAPGSKPEPPWSDSLYRSVGKTLAKLHASADSFSSDHSRSAVRSGDEPQQVIAVLDESDWRRQLVQRSAAAAHHALDRLARQGLRWGIQHGDPSLDNIHITEDGDVYFYDLDLAAPGWQVEDLTGALSTEFGDPFLEGYVAVRPLPAVDLEALPWLRILAHIDNLKFHLIDKPAALGSATLAEGWVDSGFQGLANAAKDAGLEDPHSTEAAW